MKEDIQFLKELQEELKTQEIDSQAAPRFWTLMDYREVPTYDGYEDKISYFYNDGDHVEFNTVSELKEFLEEYCLDDDEFGGLKEMLDDNKIDFEEMWEFVKDYLNDDGFFNELPVREESFIVPDTMFITKAEAQKHINLNHYHYTNKVHTYAMTAWRSAKVERLLKILEEFDWDSIELK